MSKLDDFINNFFDRIKKRQANRIIARFKKSNPELSKKLDKIDKASQELADYIKKNSIE